MSFAMKFLSTAVVGVSGLVWYQWPAASIVVEPLEAPTALTGPDLESRPLANIPVGTVIGTDGPPTGYTHLLIHATPTLTEDDAKNAPALALKFARMFRYTLVAKVGESTTRGKRSFYLETVSHGFAVDGTGSKPLSLIVNGNDTKGTDLGIFGRQILDENEKILAEDVRQVCRTPTLFVFDAKCVMLRGTDHENMVMRHAILVDEATGGLTTVVGLLTKEFEPAEAALQRLPAALQEKRYLSVKKDEFRLGIPTRKAFALRQTPPGTPVPYTPGLKSAFAVKAFRADSAVALESALRPVTK